MNEIYFDSMIYSNISFIYSVICYIVIIYFLFTFLTVLLFIFFFSNTVSVHANSIFFLRSVNGLECKIIKPKVASSLCGDLHRTHSCGSLRRVSSGCSDAIPSQAKPWRVCDSFFSCLCLCLRLIPRLRALASEKTIKFFCCVRVRLVRWFVWVV